MKLSDQDRAGLEPHQAREGAQPLVGIECTETGSSGRIAMAEHTDPTSTMEPLPLSRAQGENATQERCETCGNCYDKSFHVVIRGETHVFDCFECAIQRLAPTCAHCGCRIIGHGVEATGTYYCCAHCAQVSGVKGAEDRV